MRSAPVFMDVSGKAMTLGVRARVRRALAAFGSYTIYEEVRDVCV